MREGIYVYFFLVSYGYGGVVAWGARISSQDEGGMNGRRNSCPPSFLLDFNLYLLSHICFPRLLRIVTELCIGPRNSRGEKWYNIKPPPRIIKQRAWALNEGCCVKEYMFIFSLSHMGMAVLLFGGQEFYPKMGAE